MKKILLFALVLSFTSLFAQQQFQNASFEEWESVVIGQYDIEPVNWSSIKTSDSDNMNSIAPVVWERSDDARTGDYSLKLYSVATLGIVATGTMCNGRIHASLNTDEAYTYTDPTDQQWHHTFTSRPDSVVGYFKSIPTDDDFPTVKVALHTGDLQIPGDETNIVGMAYIELPGGVHSEWTRFSVAFEYYKDIDPEYELTILTAGDGVSALGDGQVWYDDIEFVYNGSSVDEYLINDFKVYASNGIINVFNSNEANGDFTILVNDIMGRELFKGPITQGENLEIETPYSGVYVVSVIQDNNISSKKVLVN